MHPDPRSAGTALLLALLAAASPAARAEQGAAHQGERYLSEFSAGSLPVWLPESALAIDPETVPHMAIFEVTREPQARRPTGEQQRAADDFVRRCREAAEANGWYDFERAVADGYERMFEDEVHYVKRAFLKDGRVLDPTRPEFLMYYPTDEGKKLAGYMFLVEDPAASGPQIGGPLTLWHFHVWGRKKCLYEGLLVVGDADAEGRCAEGVPSHVSPEMLHVWFVDHPKGPFSTQMHLEPWMIDELKGHHHH